MGRCRQRVTEQPGVHHMLNAGADYYLDAWLPAAELIARVRVVLRFSAWLAESYDHKALAPHI
jgi:DNA-binding response OmpR family regulator